MIDWSQGGRAKPETVEQVTRRCLALAEELGVRSIVFPALGTGDGGLKEPSVEAMVDTIFEVLAKNQSLEVTLTLAPRRWWERSLRNRVDVRKLYEYIEAVAPRYRARRQPR